ncbi:Cytosolic sulfotransferase 1 [Raphanus sativus]|uniref:Sulfotransferase n=1 Tax=Raphanus sativus TaxID=3726 RepID=A0A6J0KGB4_RAPSA|nr:cytosolic sulfotransferase 1-like [Raphanus sativus]KAJ4883388.1 Cytosolic sulfotransferase 1 [Raphanus sativus]
MDQKEIPRNLRDDNLSEETKTLISQLQSEIDTQGNKLYNYQGCWYYSATLQGILNFQRNFKPQDSDIFIASFPKSGATWLKALTVSLFERSKHPSSYVDHPLLSNNPHALVQSLEANLYLDSQTPDLKKAKLSSPAPRMFSTHMPLLSLQETIKDSPCKIIYLCRDVKDALVSRWYFRCSYLKKEVDRHVLESMFESFCSGVSFYGPFWDHVLSYWRGSLEEPSHVLFMRYEEMKEDPYAQLKRLAEFLGCPFTKEEEESGSMDEILELCSLRRLSDLEVNRTGKTSNDVDYKFFFRKGEVGDSKNHLSPEMESKIDKIVQEKLEGSGLKF